MKLDLCLPVFRKRLLPRWRSTLRGVGLFTIPYFTYGTPPQRPCSRSRLPYSAYSLSFMALVNDVVQTVISTAIYGQRQTAVVEVVVVGNGALCDNNIIIIAKPLTAIVEVTVVGRWLAFGRSSTPRLVRDSGNHRIQAQIGMRRGMCTSGLLKRRHT